MRRKIRSPKELIATGILMAVIEILCIIVAFNKKSGHWQWEIVLMILLVLMAMTMICSGIAWLKKEKAEKAANEAKSDDNGAKTGESCTISPVPAPDDTTMVQNYNLPKEE